MEAFIAIMLILGVLIVLYSNAINKPKKSEEVYNTEKIILDEISFNEDLRNAVMSNNTAVLMEYVAGRIGKSSFNYTVRICTVEDVCSLSIYKKEFYAKDRIIGSNLTSYEPKKVKIFMWIDN